MKQLLLILVLIVLGVVAYTYYSGPREAAAPELTREQALTLLGAQLPMECLAQGVEGAYQECIVDIAGADDQRIVAVTYDGWFDDSVRATRHEATLSYRDGAWVAGPVSETYRCQAGRGQQDFAPELCL